MKTLIFSLSILLIVACVVAQAPAIERETPQLSQAATVQIEYRIFNSDTSSVPIRIVRSEADDIASVDELAAYGEGYYVESYRDGELLAPREPLLRPAEPMAVGLEIGKSGEDVNFVADHVGIGTSSPGEKLDVNGSIDWTEMYWDSGENIKMRGAGEFSFDFADADGNDYWHVWDPSHGAILAVRNNGNVGIGTASPSQKLHVVGNSLMAGRIYVGTTDAYFYRDAANRIATPDDFYVQASSGNTYLYSTNTYLGNTSGDATHLRGNSFDWTSGGGGIINTSGNVGIGTTSPDASAKLDITSTSSGLLIPRMTTAQRDAIDLTDNPNSVVIFNTTTECFEFYYNGSWYNIACACTPPYVPVATAATEITLSQFTANWTAAAGADGYYLDVSEYSDFSSYVSGYENLDVGDVTSYDVTGLSAGTTYYYRVRAYNDCGTSGNSNVISVTTAMIYSLTTTWAAGNGQDGNMFDIVTSSDEVTLTGFDCNVDGTGSVTIEVWYRTNTYSGHSGSSGWIEEGSYTTTAAGSGNPTHIDIGGINIPASSTYGIYLTTTGSPGFNYTNGSNTYSDGTITINTGYGNAYRFGSYYSPRTWNGTVYYTR